MKILRLPNVCQKIGLSQSAVRDRYDKNSTRHDETFPKPIKLGGGRNTTIGFIESEIDNWLTKQMGKRDLA